MTTAEEGIEPELVDNGLSEDEDGDDDWDENDGSVRRCDTKNNGHEGEDELYKAMKFVLIVGATVGLTPLVAAPEGHGPSHPYVIISAQSSSHITSCWIILLNKNSCQIFPGSNIALHPMYCPGGIQCCIYVL